MYTHGSFSGCMDSMDGGKLVARDHSDMKFPKFIQPTGPLSNTYLKAHLKVEAIKAPSYVSISLVNEN